MGNYLPCIGCYGKNSIVPHEIRLRILLVGLDNAGKTTTAYALTGDSKEVVPTVGFLKHVLSQQFCGCHIEIYDVGGGSDIRAIWTSYFAECHGFVFVVDASDTLRVDECRRVLHDLLKHKCCRGKSVLLLGNKQDSDTCMDTVELDEKLDLELAANRNQCPMKIQLVSSLHASALATSRNRGRITGNSEPLCSAFTWLIETIKSDFVTLESRVQTDTANQILQTTHNHQSKVHYANKDGMLGIVPTPLLLLNNGPMNGHCGSPPVYHTPDLTSPLPSTTRHSAAIDVTPIHICNGHSTFVTGACDGVGDGTSLPTDPCNGDATFVQHASVCVYVPDSAANPRDHGTTPGSENATESDFSTDKTADMETSLNHYGDTSAVKSTCHYGSDFTPSGKSVCSDSSPTTYSTSTHISSIMKRKNRKLSTRRISFDHDVLTTDATVHRRFSDLTYYSPAHRTLVAHSSASVPRHKATGERVVSCTRARAASISGAAVSLAGAPSQLSVCGERSVPTALADTRPPSHCPVSPHTLDVENTRVCCAVSRDNGCDLVDTQQLSHTPHSDPPAAHSTHMSHTVVPAMCGQSAPVVTATSEHLVLSNAANIRPMLPDIGNKSDDIEMRQATGLLPSYSLLQNYIQSKNSSMDDTTIINEDYKLLANLTNTTTGSSLREMSRIDASSRQNSDISSSSLLDNCHCDKRQYESTAENRDISQDNCYQDCADDDPNSIFTDPSYISLNEGMCNGKERVKLNRFFRRLNVISAVDGSAQTDNC